MVKNIIISKKTGKKSVNKNPVSLLMTIGARQADKSDPIIVKSQNTRLQHFKIGKLSSTMKLDPNSFRSRVFKRRDVKQKLQNIFMKQDEVENCTFEPSVGTQNAMGKDVNDETKEIVPGEYFNSLGVNLASKNPKIFKQGILKKAFLHLKNNDVERSFNTMFEGFNVERLFANFNNHDYKAVTNYDELKAGKINPVDKLKEEMEKRFKALEKKQPYLIKFIRQLCEKSQQMVKDN